MLGRDWAAAAKIEARCDKCQHMQAYYFQLQIRSADEPMTIFYKCANCGEQWTGD